MPAIGTVKWYNPDRRFGFVKVEERDEELFFHLNDGRTSEPGILAVFFTTNNVQRIPRIGDRIVFQRGKGRDDRPKASPWGYHNEWEEAERLIKNRPPLVVYRALEQMNSIGSPPGPPKILWMGSDTAQLLRELPLPRRGQSPSADPMLSYWSDSDNMFEVRRWWEKQLPDGSWERCDDPRPLPGVLRQFERINRP